MQIKPLTREDKRNAVIARLKIVPEASDRFIAYSLGVSSSFVWRLRQELQAQGVLKERMHTQDDSWTRHPYLLANKEQLLNGGLSEKSLRALKAPMVLDKMAEINSLSPRYAQRLLYKERKAANKNPAVTISEDDVRIFQADIRSGLPEVATGSVSLCFVDMPYQRKAVEELTPHIAITASRILVSRGSLLLMIGGSHLNTALELLTKTDKTLKYQWDIVYICPRGTPLIQGRRVTTAVKHIIWMVKNKYDGPIQHDLIYSPPDPESADKEHHEWGQSVEVIGELIKRFTAPMDLVCDFMVGGGSSAVSSVLNNRRFVGSDIDPMAVKTTKQRVAELFGSK